MGPVQTGINGRRHLGIERCHWPPAIACLLCTPTLVCERWPVHGQTRIELYPWYSTSYVVNAATCGKGWTASPNTLFQKSKQIWREVLHTTTRFLSSALNISRNTFFTPPFPCFIQLQAFLPTSLSSHRPSHVFSDVDNVHDYMSYRCLSIQRTVLN